MKFYSLFPVCLISILLLSGCKQKQNSVSQNTTHPNAPAFDLTDITGAPISSSSFKGKWTVINIWATWCPPCVREIPHFVAVQSEMKDQNVRFIGISVDEGSKEVVESFYNRMNMNYPVVIANLEDMTKIFGEITAIPTTFIINPQWQIVKRHTGYLNKDELKNALETRIKSSEK
jgi:thiol-disulfide isomerase/thioredoxin